MLTVTKRIGNQIVTIDLHAITLGNDYAYKLSREALFTQMERLGIKDIHPNMGMVELLTKLSIHQHEQREQAA